MYEVLACNLDLQDMNKIVNQLSSFKNSSQTISFLQREQLLSHNVSQVLPGQENHLASWHCLCFDIVSFHFWDIYFNTPGKQM